MAASITTDSAHNPKRFPNLETVVGRMLLPTPQASSLGGRTVPADAKWQGLTVVVSGERKMQVPLETAVKKLLPTPTASLQGGRVNHCAQGKGGWDLASAVTDSMSEIPRKLWPTPTAQDGKNNAGPSQYSRNSLPLNVIVGGRLNPEFVEFMMGFPIGWTDLEASEMR
jgi:hypothetical protein